MSGDSDIFSIDFGTTNSIACIYKNEQILCIENPERPGYHQFPSFVDYCNYNITAGYAAKRNYGKRGHFVVAAVKRILGLTYDQYVSKINNKSIFGCQVVCGEDRMPRFIVSEDRSKLVTPVEVASELFKTIKKHVDNKTNRSMSKACVTVPVNFNDQQKNAIVEAARLAGITVIKLIDEPTAAVMSWCMDHTNELIPGDDLVVYDFGGGTFDASHVRYSNENTFEIMNTDGDAELGGNDIDTIMMNHFLNKHRLLSENHNTVSLEEMEERKVMNYRNDCQGLKEMMNSRLKYFEDEKDFRTKNGGINQELDMEDYSDKLEKMLKCDVEDMIEICKPVVERSFAVTRQLLERTRCYESDIRFFFLVGGSSKLHSVKHTVKKIFTNAVFADVNPDEAVAVGAMKIIVNGIEENPITNSSYGLLSGTDDVILLLKKGQPVPAKSEQFEFMNEKDFQQIYECCVYQWNGNPDNAFIVKRNECNLVSKFEFAHPMPTTGKQSMLLQFELNSEHDLEVKCYDKNSNVPINHTVIRGKFTTFDYLCLFDNSQLISFSFFPSFLCIIIIKDKLLF